MLDISNMPDESVFSGVLLRTAEVDEPSENDTRTDRAVPKRYNDFSIYVGTVAPIVGRPVAIVTYRRTVPPFTEGRHEASTYCAFFTHEQESFSSALSQRPYYAGVYPRLGAKTMLERGRDEAELALGQWLADWGRANDTPVVGGPLEFQPVSLNALFGLYVFSPVVRACVQTSLGAFTNERLTAALSGWTSEVGVNTVPLHTAAAT